MASDTAVLGEAQAPAPPSLASIAPAGAATLLVATGAAWVMDSPLAWSVALATAAAIAAALAFALRGRERFGIGNGVTMVRLGLAAALLAPVASTGRTDPSWLLVTTLVGLLALDGIDGWLARRRNEASSFGARFDMEADTVVLCVLTVLVLATGRGHVALLLVGCLRPMFVMAGRLWPWLAAPLPPSFRRKALCVLPIALLAAALAPPVGAYGAITLGFMALGLLVLSFAIDLAWLVARRDRRSG